MIASAFREAVYFLVSERGRTVAEIRGMRSLRHLCCEATRARARLFRMGDDSTIMVGLMSGRHLVMPSLLGMGALPLLDWM